MPDDIHVETHIVKFQSTGVPRRLFDVLETAAQRGRIVHVTGDIHFVVLGLLGRRSVLTVHDCGSSIDLGGELARSVYRTVWLRWPVRRATRVVAVSEFTKTELVAQTGIDPARISVIPTTIDNGFTPVPCATHDGPARLLFLGSTPNKNLSRCIDALAGLDVHLDVIGVIDPALQARLATADFSSTIYRGLTDPEVRARYELADVVLFPSTYEGFGMPIVEAQAVGRPVITSDRAPMNEVAGGAAHLVDPEDVASIRAGVERVLGDAVYRADLIDKGFVNRERYRPEVAARAYAQLYRELAQA